MVHSAKLHSNSEQVGQIKARRRSVAGGETPKGLHAVSEDLYESAPSGQVDATKNVMSMEEEPERGKVLDPTIYNPSGYLELVFSLKTL